MKIPNKEPVALKGEKSFQTAAVDIVFDPLTQ